MTDYFDLTSENIAKELGVRDVSARVTTSAPVNEVDVLIREATQQVEEELVLEDQGWITLGLRGDVITSAERVDNVQLSRLYAIKDPLATQAIRLWTDYSFGTGMTWQTEEEQTKKVLESFWGAKANKNVLSPRGQRKSSDKLLADGEIFYALFFGAEGQVTIRYIDPLEITEIITDKDDKEEKLFYRRAWQDASGGGHTAVYRDVTNRKGKSGIDSNTGVVTHDDEAMIYHLTYNTTTQRGNPLLLPVLDWIKQYRRFLASRVAIILALARFAWKTKVMGGQATVNAIKAKTNEEEIKAGSQLIENMGSDTTPIKMDSGASSAYQDGRMLKLQFCSGVGFPEQYFGDISIGNLATAKTVELPVTKMCQSYQSVWDGAYKDLDEIVLEYNKVPEDKWYVDRNFPAIAPEDYAAMAESIEQIITVMPQLAKSDAVVMQALLSIGVNNPAEVIEALNELEKENKEEPEPTEEAIRLRNALKQVREVLTGKKEEIQGDGDWVPQYHKRTSNAESIDDTNRQYEGGLE